MSGAKKTTTASLSHLKRELRKKADPQKAKFYQRFFKTGPGEYGEGDKFIGVVVPELWKLARKYQGATFSEIEKMLRSAIHEERLVVLMILVEKMKKTKTELDQKKIYQCYIKNSKKVNNWDLVDLTAPKVVGTFLRDKDRSLLMKFSRSKNLWEKRISIIATYRFIQEEDYKDTLKISKVLLEDEHDLIHKAVGWMLREVGKRDLKCEENFLKKHYQKMPRTMLRYAIERFPEKKRKAYLKGTVV